MIEEIRKTLQYLESLHHDPKAILFMFLSLFIISKLLVSKLKLTTRSKINLPPSPPKLPLIGNYHQLGTLPHRSFQELSQKYGPLLMLHLGQLPLLLVSSADMAREVMQTHGTVFASRHHLTSTKALLYGCKDVAFASYGDAWRQKRKLCVLELLSLKRVQSTKFIREEEVATLVEEIRSNGCSVNLSEMLIATTNNIICRSVFGRKYDVDGCGFGQVVRKVMMQISDFSVGDMFPLLGWVDVLTGQIQKFKDTFQELDAFFDHVIATRKMERRDSEKKKTFLDVLLQLEEGGIGMSELELTQDDLKGLILDMFLGGSDTTSTTVEWAIAELVKNPLTMKKVQEEVRNVVGDKSKIEENDVNQMEYLKCVVKETLRLHPAAPLVGRETISSVKLGGYDIPNKTMVYINAWAIQRDPEFWERPQEFIPERFENNKVNFNGQDFQFIPFGSGKRNCAGMAFGVASVEYMVANLLCWFDWKLPTSVQDLDMTEKFGVTVNRKEPLNLEPMPYNNSV